MNNTSAVQIIIKALSAPFAAAGAAAMASEGSKATAPSPIMDKSFFIINPPLFLKTVFSNLIYLKPIGMRDKSLKLQCCFVGFTSTNTDNTLQFSNENFAITDLAGIGRFADHIDHF